MVGMAVIAPVSHAADINFNGFASVVAGKTVKDSAAASIPGVTGLDTNSRYSVASVYGGNDSAYYDDDLSFKPETNLALQLTSNLGDGLSVVAQLTGQGANDFDVEFEWLYISYELSDNLNAKAGRLRVPLYTYSDYLDVGYAYHWIRPPQDVYNLSFSSYEGVSLTYSNFFGGWDTNIQGYFGSLDNDTSQLGKLEFSQIWGGVLTANYDWLEVRAAYHRADAQVPDLLMLSPGRPFSDGEEDIFDYKSLGMKANFGDLFFGLEYTVGGLGEIVAANPTNETGLDSITSWYFTAGYRYGKWTPHITRSSTTNDYESDDLNGDGFLLTGYRHDRENVRESWIFGLRYDFHSSAAIKIEYTNSSDESDSEIIAVEGEGNEVSTLAVGIDVIF